MLFFISRPTKAELQISSYHFKEGSQIKEVNVFNGFGCKGQNISPQISIIDIPKEAKSLALTMYDPDAPTGSGWWHWIVYNMPTYTKNIFSSDSKLTKPAIFGRNAVFGRNDYGTNDYGGPCPPIGSGKHRYILTIYALSVDKLSVPNDASAALIGYNINAHTIEKASITAYYGRNN
jgi:Raf kinase inhibitor-like YbhB/YbcL family protein